VHNFVDPNRMVITMCAGEVTRDEVVASLTDLRERSDVKPDFRQLVDFSQDSRLEPDFKDLYRICRARELLSHKGKRAIVAPGHRSSLHNDRFKVFQSLVDAMSWLGLEVNVLVLRQRLTTLRSATGRASRCRNILCQ
jgi:hypothetical protein